MKSLSFFCAQTHCICLPHLEPDLLTPLLTLKNYAQDLLKTRGEN